MPKRKENGPYLFLMDNPSINGLEGGGVSKMAGFDFAQVVPDDDFPIPSQ
jgi:hypothetical protein